MTFKFKAGAEIITDDFWYDLTDGGYIEPSKILSDKAQIEEVERAIALLRSFKEQAEDDGVMEER